MSQTTKIIIFILILFVASSVFLFWKSDRGLDMDYQKDWWSVSFAYAKNTDLSFVIENHSDNNNFSWEIISGKETLQKSDIAVARGEKKNLEIDLSDLTGRVFVRVSDGKTSQEIYKNL
ncbi:MAG: hypothetical protein CO140_04250 [Candidatus Moranbacteria bacterium CG_4_9_14_3_um_filter_40_7]|nr:MAG: hypothetical protein COX31_01935 [Candidatus Moranbacteria bacterium CG23_combo_of_CG06-09_8_20_14_all_40_16]PIU81007.1 MAG: hypothetical protein COS71_00425 [Candidatus Moranbacteria bacterium CG06_land_8_20_14_3_00_40_12]PJA87451.1 MAG: hypothetical protein CO140_04250 [Candidatus Moranbacteria bacterium CG_4_9_14_3_um_filter_40_7]